MPYAPLGAQKTYDDDDDDDNDDDDDGDDGQQSVRALCVRVNGLSCFSCGNTFNNNIAQQCNLTGL